MNNHLIVEHSRVNDLDRDVDRKNALLPLAHVYVVVALWLFSTGSLPIFRAIGLGQAVYLLIYFVAMLGLLVPGWKSRTVNRNLPFLVVVTSIPVLSVLWSANAEISMQRVIALLGTTVFAYYFAAKFKYEQQHRILASLIFIVCVASVGLVALEPETGIDATGKWQAMFVNKNALGRFMGVGLAFSVLQLVHGQISRALTLTNAFLCSVLLVLSESKSALVVWLVALALIPLFRVMRLHRSVAVPTLILILGSGVYAFQRVWESSSEILDAMGKDSSLTGRTYLWDLVLVAIRERTLLGYGYGSFWLGWDGPSAEIWKKTGWDPPHAHMGYLDVWLELGLVGLGCVVVVLVVLLIRSFLSCLDYPSVTAYWTLMYVTMFIIYNFSESTVLKQNSYDWILFIVVMLNLGGLRPNRPDV